MGTGASAMAVEDAIEATPSFEDAMSAKRDASPKRDAAHLTQVNPRSLKRMSREQALEYSVAEADCVAREMFEAYDSQRVGKLSIDIVSVLGRAVSKYSR